MVPLAGKQSLSDQALPQELVDSFQRLVAGDFSYRMPRSLARDESDAVAFFFNTIADELERTVRETQAGEQRLNKAVEAISAVLIQVAAGNLQAQIDRDYKGDQLDVLAYLVNTMISELNELVAENQRRNAEIQARLEALIEERTGQLREARDAAETANRTKSAFLASMSHELRTPLNAIIGYSEMLQEEAQDLGPAAQELVPDLDKIHVAGRHLLSLINDILDLSKIEAGKMNLELDQFDPALMLQEVINTIRPLLEKGSNTLVTQYPENLGVMRADLTRVRQILLNLLSNAAKFTDHGTVTLRVDRQPIVGADGRSVDGLIFQISDTGIGMTAAQIDQLFQAFVQADVSTSRKYGGTGLGLVITKSFCEMMGGNIRVESEVGRGSTFSVQLPVEVRAGRAAPTVRAINTAPPAGQRVLVIDDDSAVREMLQRYLSKEGFQVTTASTGSAGVRLAKEIKPQAITLDVMMPGMDGWAVLTTLKADPELADIPVIMLTIIEDRSLGYALGAADYLIKPVERERLLEVLRQHACAELPCSILVVEDDLEIREMMRRTLAREGWQVCEAGNGREALEQIEHVRPHLILLDLMMPEMDGFQFVTELRKHEDWRTIPIVVVTAKDLTPEDRARLSGSVETVLQKGSYRKEDLLSEVRELIDAHRQRQPAVSKGQ
jgi:signal transduction histidine kinase/DNA-binding response OmpR family regulator